MKLRIFARCGIVLVAVCVLVWAVVRPAELKYNGKPLTFWLKPCIPGNETPGGERELHQTMNVIGTNAIPTLLRLLKARDSRAKVNWIKLLDWLRDSFGLVQPYTRGWEKNYEGYLGLGNSELKPRMPSLT